MRIDVVLHRIQSVAFTLVTTGTMVLYGVLWFNVFPHERAVLVEWLTTIQYWVKVYISLFLIYRFNALRRPQFTSLDVAIAFNAGCYLFLTLGLNTIV